MSTGAAEAVLWSHVPLGCTVTHTTHKSEDNLTVHFEDGTAGLQKHRGAPRSQSWPAAELGSDAKSSQVVLGVTGIHVSSP